MVVETGPSVPMPVQSYRPSLSSLDGTARRSQVHVGLTSAGRCPAHTVNALPTHHSASEIY